MKNYYDELEVSKKASKEVIEKAYKVLAKKYHPDSTKESDKGASEERFKAISEAYNTLSDDFKRKEYDKELEESSPTISYEEYEYVLNKNRDLEDEIDYLHQRMNNSTARSSSSSSNSSSKSRSGFGSKYFDDSPRGYYNRFTDSFVNPRASDGSSYTDRSSYRHRTRPEDTEDFTDGKSPKRTFYYSDTGKPASAFDYYVYRIKSVGSNFFFTILVFIIILLVIRGVLLLTFGDGTSQNAVKNTLKTNTIENTSTSENILNEEYQPYVTNETLPNHDNPIQEFLNLINNYTKTNQSQKKIEE